MTQMIIAGKQKQAHRQQTWGCQEGEGEGRIGHLGIADASVYGTDKKQDPTVQYREVYSVSCGKPECKGMWKNMYNWAIWLYNRN